MGQSDYLKLGDHNSICDYCGFKFKGSELRGTWDGYEACRTCWQPRQPQDYVRGVLDDQSVEKSRPEGTDVFTAEAQDLTPWDGE